MTVHELLGALTLPSLQEFHTNEWLSLTPAHLPALVHRSSCPLTTITLFEESEVEFVDDLEPLRGVTDLVLEEYSDPITVRKLLLEEYFPDLRHLTLRLEPFLDLWRNGILSMVLDRKRQHCDAPNGGRLLKVLVVDPLRHHDFDRLIWRSKIGEKLKGLNIRPREDGFEFL
jgi:hypothetical protein